MFKAVIKPKLFKLPISAVCVDFNLKILEEPFAKILLPTNLSTASKERQAEYLAGRLCASKALAVLDQNLKNFPILCNNDRIPIWPNGYCGSITHTTSYAAAAVAQKSEYLSLGIDSEFIFESGILKDLGDVATKEEINKLTSILNLETAMTILFSAKESVFKAFYPITRRWMDFKDIELNSCTPHQLNFSILNSSLSTECQFEVTSSIVHTLVAVKTNSI